MEFFNCRPCSPSKRKEEKCSFHDASKHSTIDHSLSARWRSSCAFKTSQRSHIRKFYNFWRQLLRLKILISIFWRTKWWTLLLLRFQKVVRRHWHLAFTQRIASTRYQYLTYIATFFWSVSSCVLSVLGLLRLKLFVRKRVKEILSVEGTWQ